MARIPDSELERIKGQVSLARLIRGPGHPARLAGKDLACRCPWHEGDDTPSCVVTPKTNLWHCAIPAGQADADQALLDQVIGFYHQTLKASPEALAYLEHRGLGSMELIERFRLGYANRTLAYRLAPKQYKAGAQLRTALQRVGILRESGHEHLMARSSCRCLLLSMAALDPSWAPTAGGIGRPEHQDSGAAPPSPLSRPPRQRRSVSRSVPW